MSRRHEVAKKSSAKHEDPFGMDPFGGMLAMRNDIFGDMDKMFGGFIGGGRGMDLMRPFNDILSRFDQIRMDDEPDFMLNKFKGGKGMERLDNGQNGGHFISQTFVYSSKPGQDGKPKVEKYSNTNVQGLTSDGKKISQIDEMYKNSETGVKKLSQQRNLDGHGRKFVKSKVGGGKAFLNSGPEEIHNFYYGMDEEDGDNFINRWEQEAQKIHFQDWEDEAKKSKNMLMTGLEKNLGGKNPGFLQLMNGDDTPSEVSRRSSHHKNSKLPVQYEPSTNSRTLEESRYSENGLPKKKAAETVKRVPFTQSQSKAYK